MQNSRNEGFQCALSMYTAESCFAQRQGLNFRRLTRSRELKAALMFLMKTIFFVLLRQLYWLTTEAEHFFELKETLMFNRKQKYSNPWHFLGQGISCEVTDHDALEQRVLI